MNNTTELLVGDMKDEIASDCDCHVCNKFRRVVDHITAQDKHITELEAMVKSAREPRPMSDNVIDLMIDTIRTWMTVHGELRSREGLTTTPDTHMMTIPGNFWPTHHMFENWIKTLEAQRNFNNNIKEVPFAIPDAENGTTNAT